MIARPLQLDDELPLRPGSRSGRSAVERRLVRTRRLRYAGVSRMVAVASVLTFCIVAYLGLMANVTRLNYEYQKNAIVRARLIDETAQLDDRIARLDSRERLGGVAERLGMREPPTLSEIVLPAERLPAAPRGIAFLTWRR